MGKFRFENGRFSLVRKVGPQASRILRKLREFLDRNEPTLVYFLLSMWNNQGKAITYKELREAILAGEIDANLLDEWQQDYSKFVVEHLQPAWIMAIEAATEALKRRFPQWHFDPMAEGVQDWTANRAADFVTNSTQEQINAIRAVVRRAASLEDMSVDQLARAIRPMVGLTQQQATANFNYYQNLLENGTSKKRALDLSTRYAARQHRYRGYNIARTELAFAYNKGSYEGTKQAQEAGYLGDVVKVWRTADDERVCSICGSLDGKRIAMDEDFQFPTKLQATNPGIRRTPPAHPSCRCAVAYEEITPPIIR